MNVLDKVRKLLRMAKDASSPHEAAIAAKQARSLIDRHQLSEMELTQTEVNEFGEEFVTFGHKTIVRWVSMLSLQVARLNDTRSVWIEIDNKKTVRFQGYLVDAVCSVEMMKYLQDVCMRQSKVHVQGRSPRNNFRLGFALGIRDQVDEIMKERNQLNVSDGKSLVVVKDQLVTQEFGEQRVRRLSGNVGDNHACNTGREVGRSISLNRQVSGHSRAAAYLG